MKLSFLIACVKVEERKKCFKMSLEFLKVDGYDFHPESHPSLGRDSILHVCLNASARKR